MVDRGAGKVVNMLAAILLPVLVALPLVGCGAGTGNDGDQVSRAPLDMTVGGASPSGFFRIIGEGMNAIVREEYPGSSIAYQPGSPAGSLALAADGRVELAMPMAVIDYNLANAGEPPFERSLEGDYLGVMQIHEKQKYFSIATEDFANEHGIESMQDLADKKPPVRIAINQQGNIDAIVTAREILAPYGITFEDIEEWGGEIFYVASGDAFALINDRRADMVLNGGLLPFSSIDDTARNIDLVWVGLDKAKLEETVETTGQTVVQVQPETELPFIDEPQWTVGGTHDVVANADVSEDDIYRFVKAFLERPEDMQALSPQLNDFSGEGMVKVEDRVPLHPGAEKAYREAGLLD